MWGIFNIFLKNKKKKRIKKETPTTYGTLPPEHFGGGRPPLETTPGVVAATLGYFMTSFQMFFFKNILYIYILM